MLSHDHQECGLHAFAHDTVNRVELFPNGSLSVPCTYAATSIPHLAYADDFNAFTLTPSSSVLRFQLHELSVDFLLWLCW
eukprot:m.24329 g.24329  ORF g.24329 m.24329 type:complete len:80 (-) comp8588_c0_seq2:3780-4019(-)